MSAAIRAVAVGTSLPFDAYFRKRKEKESVAEGTKSEEENEE